MLQGKPRDKLFVENCIKNLSTGDGPRAFNAEGDLGTKGKYQKFSVDRVGEL